MTLSAIEGSSFEFAAHGPMVLGHIFKHDPGVIRRDVAVFGNDVGEFFRQRFMLLDRLRKTKTNYEFLTQVQQTATIRLEDENDG